MRRFLLAFVLVGCSSSETPTINMPLADGSAGETQSQDAAPDAAIDEPDAEQDVSTTDTTHDGTVEADDVGVEADATDSAQQDVCTGVGSDCYSNACCTGLLCIGWKCANVDDVCVPTYTAIVSKTFDEDAGEACVDVACAAGETMQGDGECKWYPGSQSGYSFPIQGGWTCCGSTSVPVTIEARIVCQREC